MNVTIKVTLSDTQRAALALKLFSRKSKSAISRAVVRELVDGFIAALLHDETPNTNCLISAPDLSRVPAKYRDKSEAWKVSYLRGWDSLSARS